MAPLSTTSPPPHSGIDRSTNMPAGSVASAAMLTGPLCQHLAIQERDARLNAETRPLRALFRQDQREFALTLQPKAQQVRSAASNHPPNRSTATTQERCHADS